MNCRTFASPWGNEDTQTLIDILARYGVKTTFFVVGDWAEKYPESVKALHDADTICRRVTSKVQPGSIVLFHNAALHTPEALPAILDCLINDGYTVVPISQLILDPPYTIDHTGRQFPAETASTT